MSVPKYPELQVVRTKDREAHDRTRFIISTKIDGRTANFGLLMDDELLRDPAFDHNQYVRWEARRAFDEAIAERDRGHWTGD